MKPEYIYRARLVSIYDGDTLRADIDLGFHAWLMDQSIRLYGINTPEIRGPEKPEGVMVRDLVKQWLPEGAAFTLHSIEDRHGKYGRILGLIYPDGWAESINARLYRGGMAKLEGYSDAERRHIEGVLKWSD